MRSRHLSLLSISSLALATSFAPSLAGCGSGSGKGVTDTRTVGQSDFTSAPPAGQAGAMSRGAATANGGAMGAADGAAAPSASGGSKTGTAVRSVEETDIYRLSPDGNRLYYLNAYRGLMVFDVSNVDAPKLIGRSPIFGTPVQMIVRDKLAVVVVADWYGTTEDGRPFRGSIVRGLDVTDPSNIQVTGEAQLGGDVLDTRVVGDVLYAVSEDYNWYYGMGWGYGVGVGVANAGGDGVVVGPGNSGTPGPKFVISSVSFTGGSIQQKGYKEYPGYSGAFYVNPNSIVMAHDVTSVDPNGNTQYTGKSQIDYIDISDPGGAIALRGSLPINGSFQGWGTDNGRWNVDFADTQYAHVLTCNGQYCGGQNGYLLSTVDFTNPAAPAMASTLTIAGAGWSPAARFDSGRLYLSPQNGYYYGPNGQNPGTPVQIFDLSNPKAPKLAGQTTLAGNVWNFTPVGGKQIFALGNQYDYTNNYSSSKVSLQYIDVSDPTAPTLIGDATFGDGWAWTPAADTFKAFTMDATKGLVVLPFSGWSQTSYDYNDGLQLIEFTPTSIATSGTAKTKGWVERGIFVGNRLVSMSDLALSVIDYSNHASPRVTAELTLARNVVDARPDGATIAQLSTDWWGYDTTKSELRVLPIGNAEENTDEPNAVDVQIDGSNARVFRNGDFAYVVSTLYDRTNNNGTATPQVQVVDLAGGTAVPRGKIALPASQNGSYYPGGFYGCYWYDWYDGDDAVQVGSDVLAFRRYHWDYNSAPNGDPTVQTELFVLDLSNPDAPHLASVAITQENDWWWGDMRAVGDTLYTTHYEWRDRPVYDPQTGKVTQRATVRYYLDRIDLTDRAHPVIGSRINVPGVLVGASQDDPSLLYFVDYRWWDGDDNGYPRDELSVAKIENGRAYLQSTTLLDGWIGNVFVRGSTAYTTTEKYTNNGPYGQTTMSLHQIDLSNPQHPVDSATAPKEGWGWLLGVEGDRAIVTSGWGGDGVDIFKLAPNTAPAYDQFARVRGWYANSLARQGGTIYLASGYWGVQAIPLK